MLPDQTDLNVSPKVHRELPARAVFRHTVMRVASRVIGSILLFCGVCFLGLPILLVVTNTDSWLGGLFFVAVGVGLLLAGRYYLRLNVDAPDEEEEPQAQRFALFVTARRRELSVVALVGLVVSVGRLIALYLGSDWPVWARWPLILGCCGLLVLAPKTPKDLPIWAGRLLTVWFFGLVLFGFLLVWSHWFRPYSVLRENGLNAGFIAFLYALEALSFAYDASQA